MTSPDISFSYTGITHSCSLSPKYRYYGCAELRKGAVIRAESLVWELKNHSKTAYFDYFDSIMFPKARTAGMPVPMRQPLGRLFHSIFLAWSSQHIYRHHPGCLWPRLGGLILSLWNRGILQLPLEFQSWIQQCWYYSISGRAENSRPRRWDLMEGQQPLKVVSFGVNILDMVGKILTATVPPGLSI